MLTIFEQYEITLIQMKLDTVFQTRATKPRLPSLTSGRQTADAAETRAAIY